MRFLFVLSIKPMVPGGNTKISIGYKYNTRKVPSFIVTDNSEIKSKVYLIYLSSLTTL